MNARFDEEAQVAAAATTTRDVLLERAATFARCPSSAAFRNAVEASTLGEVEATRELTDVTLTWIDHPDLGDKYVAALLRATARAVERGIRDEDEATLSFAP